MAILSLIILIMIPIVGIAYLVWVIRTAIRKQWRKMALQIGVPLLLLAILNAAGTVWARKEHARALAETYDAQVVLSAPIFSYDSPRHFNGDGYSIDVYELPNSIRQRFEAADQRLLSEFPKKPSYRARWSTYQWKEAPSDPALEKYVNFALSSYDSDQKVGLSEQFRAIRDALRRKRTYYSFFHYDHGNYPGNIDLFIVDLVGNRLYSINHNT